MVGRIRMELAERLQNKKIDRPWSFRCENKQLNKVLQPCGSHAGIPRSKEVLLIRRRSRKETKDNTKISMMGQKKGKDLNAMKVLDRDRDAWLKWTVAPAC